MGAELVDGKNGWIHTAIIKTTGIMAYHCINNLGLDVRNFECGTTSIRL